VTDRPQLNEEDESFCGWEALKEQILGDGELMPEDHITIGPVLREAEGRELSGLLDALVIHFRKVWRTCLALRPRLEDVALKDPFTIEEYLPFVIEAQGLLETWFRVFKCLREAETWFYRTFGPVRDSVLLDDIANSLNELHGAIDSMRSQPLDWDCLDADEEYTQEALTHLHEIARSLEEGACVSGYRREDEVGAEAQSRGTKPLVSAGEAPSAREPRGEEGAQVEAVLKRRKVGRKKLPAKEEQRRRGILGRWEQASGAGISRKRFCDDERITVKDLENYQRWAQQRDNRRQ
jgi:hypothetical protein